jgi:hypothetical protein
MRIINASLGMAPTAIPNVGEWQYGGSSTAFTTAIGRAGKVWTAAPRSTGVIPSGAGRQHRLLEPVSALRLLIGAFAGEFRQVSWPHPSSPIVAPPACKPEP